MSSGPLLFAKDEPLASRAGYSGPPRKDFPVSDSQATIAYTFLVATPIVQIVAALAFFARLYTRAHPTWRFAIDDYLISVAFVLMTVMFSLQYAALSWAWGGRHPVTRPVDEFSYSVMLGSIAIPFWGWATGLAKISVAFMLLKFQQNRGWRAFMYSMVLLNVLLIGFTGIANLFQCIPYSAIWDFEGKYRYTKRCWNHQMSAASLYTACVCNVVSDTVFSLMPLTFLGKIRRPLREKVVIGGLMSLGLLAAAFSLSRLVVAAQKRKRNKDASAYVALIGLLTCLEVQTSLIAACIPTLRSSSKRFMFRIGMRPESNNEAYPRYAPGSSVSNGVKEVQRCTVVLNEGDDKGRPPKTARNSSLAGDDDDEYPDELIVDPVTGRIIPVSNLKEAPSPSSSSSLHKEWPSGSASIEGDHGDAQSNTGVAR